jgi:hypothetical protein
VIISASRRTDLPAWFGGWVTERLREGFFQSVNPFRPSHVRTVSLKPEDVTAFVFWSKDPQPFLPVLDQLDERGYRYYFQFTVNDYPVFEPNMRSLKERLTTFQRLSDRLGPARVLWRYDPIILSNITPLGYHLDRIDTLAGHLQGHTERLTISFLDFYRKTKKRLAVLEKKQGITCFDVDWNEHLADFCRDLQALAGSYGLRLVSCCEPHAIGMQAGACIDGELLQRVFGIDKLFAKDKHQRTGCGCAQAVDMGRYGTCASGCLYCYANHDNTTC